MFSRGLDGFRPPPTLPRHVCVLPLSRLSPPPAKREVTVEPEEEERCRVLEGRRKFNYESEWGKSKSAPRRRARTHTHIHPRLHWPFSQAGHPQRCSVTPGSGGTR